MWVNVSRTCELACKTTIRVSWMKHYSLSLSLSLSLSSLSFSFVSETKRVAIFTKSLLQEHGYGRIGFGKWVTRRRPKLFFGNARGNSHESSSIGTKSILLTEFYFDNPKNGILPKSHYFHYFVIVTRIDEKLPLCLRYICLEKGKSKLNKYCSRSFHRANGTRGVNNR